MRRSRRAGADAPATAAVLGHWSFVIGPGPGSLVRGRSWVPDQAPSKDQCPKTWTNHQSPMTKDRVYVIP